MIEETKLSVSGVIDFDPERCTGCGTCELICSSRWVGMINPTLSCVTLYHNSLDDEPTCDVCNQCQYPGCLYACPAKAILVDQATGARYIDEEKCIGCGSCYQACPFTPGRAMIKIQVVNGKERYLKCDLCRGRSDGPFCVQLCPTQALKLMTAKDRKETRRPKREKLRSHT